LENIRLQNNPGILTYRYPSSPLHGVLNVIQRKFHMLTRLITLACGCILPLLHGEEEHHLPPSQQAWVDAVFEAGLIVDPTGATRVQVLIPHFSQWGGTYDTWRDAWMFPQPNGQDPVFLTTSGLPIPKEDQKEYRQVPFAFACRARVLSDTLRNHHLEQDAELIEDIVSQMIPGAAVDHPLTLAAWLVKKGDLSLANVFFQKHRTQLKPNDLDEFKHSLAYPHFLDMVDAFVNHNDAEAERQAKWLKQKFPNQYVVERKLLESEFSRRRNAGRFHQKVDLETPPPGYEKWTVEKKVDYWIDLLDEIDERQDGQPGGVNFSDHIVVHQLVIIGNPALPGLIETLENDRRLTRSVEFWRDFMGDRSLLFVREAALRAIEEILHTGFTYDHAFYEDRLSNQANKASRNMAAEIREYVKKWGHLSVPERLLLELEDETLSILGRRRRLSQLCSYRTPTLLNLNAEGDMKTTGLDPALARIQKPDVLTRVLQELEKDLKGKTEAQTRRWVLWYCGLLQELGDPKGLDAMETFRRFSDDLEYQSRLDAHIRRFREKRLNQR